jgi:colanic acid biosynthesis glycosyl transferase WcaI
MRICFFNRSYWPDQAATGQLLTELAEDLAARFGWQVTVVAGAALNAHPAHRGGTLGWPIAREERRGVTIVRANGTTFRPKRFVARAANYVTYLASAAVASFALPPQDVVVSLTDPPVIGRIALSVAKRHGAAFVFLCEDVFPEVAALVEDFHDDRVNRLLDRTYRHLLREAAAVVALGDRMRSRLVDEKGADPARVHVVHNWADCEAVWPGSKDNAFSRAHDLVDKFVVMHSGNVGLSQNLDVVVEAAVRLAAHPDVVIAMVGDGVRRQALQERANRSGLTNLRFFPYQPKELLIDSFAAADVFLVSLRPGLEGYIVPSKLYGILAAGRPFIAATDPTCEAAELGARHECGLWARPNDADALVAAILALRSNPALTAAMGHRARQLAMRFDRRVAVEAYHDLFTQLPPNTDPTREGVHLAASANAMASRAEALRRSEEARGRDADATTEPA